MQWKELFQKEPLGKNHQIKRYLVKKQRLIMKKLEKGKQWKISGSIVAEELGIEESWKDKFYHEKIFSCVLRRVQEIGNNRKKSYREIYEAAESNILEDSARMRNRAETETVE